MKIFLSYGHDHNAELVNRVKADLNALGHDCWLDSNEIKAGNDWRRSIADGIVSSEWVLSFLSRHACREWEDKGIRKKGVCLDELAIAIGVKGSIVKTILVENPNDPDSLTPPLTVSHIQYLDMHDWQSQMSKSKADFEAWYAPKWAEILRIVNSPENQKFAGEIEILRDKLQPLDNSARIGQLMANDFIGREWLLEDINNWLVEKPQQKTYCLTGEPGFGKSAIAAWLAYQNRPEIIAAHFCQYNQPNYSDPNQVIRSIAFQIATRMPDYRRFLIAKLKTLESQTSNHEIQQQIQTLLQSAQGAQVDLAQLQALMEKSKLNSSALTLKPAELFQALIADAAYLTIDGDRTRYIIIIDAVDEASNTLVEFLAQSQNMLPNWLALLVTSRPNEDGIRQHLQLLNPHYHDLADTRNQDDVSAWIVTWLTSIKIETQKQAEILQPLLKASEGNFHYLRIFRQMVEKDPKFLDTPNAYPNGLDSLYLSNFKRQFPNVDDYRLWQAPFLRLIAASRSPLPIALARNIMQMSKEQFSLKVTQPLGSLFIVKGTGDDRTIEPFHKSLRDWLTHDERAGAYYVDTEEAHLQLAIVLWEDFTETDVVEGYLLNELPYHLLKVIHINEKYAHQIIPNESVWKTHKDRILSVAVDLESTFKYVEAEGWLYLALKLSENILGVMHSDTALIQHSLAVLLSIKGDYAAAEPLFRHVLATREEVLGTEHPDTATTMQSLAVLLSHKGDYGTAEQFYRHALTTQKLILGIEHPDTATTMQNLASLLSKKGDYSAAEQLYRYTIGIQEQVLGVEHLSTATTRQSLAGLLFDKGDYTAADPLFRQVLAIRKQVLGVEHPDTATTMQNLASLLSKKGDYIQAEQLFSNALAISEKVLGAEHPDTATTMQNLAVMLSNKGDNAAAEPLFRHVLSIQERVLGIKHPDTATTMQSLASLLIDKGDYAAGELLCRSALEIRQQVLGVDHPATATTMQNLAVLMSNKGDYVAAESLFRNALAIQEQILGVEHPDNSRTIQNLALLLNAKGDLIAAEALFRQALAIREQTLGTEHSDTAKTMQYLATLLNKKVDETEAELLYRQILAIQEKKFGLKHAETAKTLQSLAEILYSKADYVASEQYLRRCLGIQEHHLGLEHPDTTESKRCLAICLRALGQYDESLHLFEQALQTRQFLLGEYHEDSLWVMINIGKLYRMQEKYALSRQVLEQALKLAHDNLGNDHEVTKAAIEEIDLLK